jgi:ATP-dependent Clp protease ATP-binding subunit ClpC
LQRIASLEEIPRSHSGPISGESRRVLERAAAEADRLGHRSIGTAHVLLGFLSTEGSLAATVLAGILKERGLTFDEARDDVVRMMNEEPE